MFIRLQELRAVWLERACRILCVFLSAIFLQNNSFAQVTADFSASITQECSPLVVCFTNLSTGGPDDLLWDFGNGSFSTDRNPCVIYATPGNYTVALTASNSGGSDTKTVNAMITVFANPVIDFSTTSSSGCVNDAIGFTDLTTLGDAPIATWRWDFGDGFVSTEQNPDHIYNTPGYYTVTLEVYDLNGCSHNLSKNNLVTILASPTVDFNAILSSSCTFPTTVTFQDLSSGSGITGYLWDFGDGNTSTQQNPVHTYNISGSYTITLTVTNSAGCSGTKTFNFSGNGSVDADFSVSDTVGCGSVSANFTDQSTSSGTIVSWAWNFGDGGTSVSQNPSHNYTAPGTYDVTLTVTDNNGCTDNIVYEDLITVYARPVADFTAGQTQGCSIPFTVIFTETATGEVSWFWEFGDGATSTLQNPSHIYASSGSYGVRLTATSADGCTATSFKPNYINIASPTADFTTVINGGCLDATVQFTDQSNSTSPITSRHWDFDDGNTSASQNPSNNYSLPGIYNVRLVVISSDGCTDTVIKPVVITLSPGPSADFTVNDYSVCIPETITFSDASVSGNAIVSWQWDFGDGNTSALQNPTHSYTAAGIFDVTLTVTDNNGCADSITYEDLMTVNANPFADFTADQTTGCTTPFTVNFTETATGDVSWLWEFSGGTTSALQNPSHVYTSSGNYSVKLTVTSAEGCTSTSSKLNYINIANPTADFTNVMSGGCLDLTVNFSDQSISTSPIIARFLDFDDGNTSVSQNPSNTYSLPGIYYVRLVVISADGCTDTIIKPITISIGTGPVADFTMNDNDVCIPEPITFSDASVSGNTIVSWHWDFGDGGTSTLQNPTHNYTAPGIYDVTLTVTDNNGCADSIAYEDLVTVNPNPFADFTADQTTGCTTPFTVNFTETAIGDVSWLWEFSGGTTSTLQNPSHVYTSSGNYSVKLTVTSAEGCTSTSSKLNYINIANPTADFTNVMSGGCLDLTVNFSDQSISTSPIIARFWDFDDGNTSVSQNPSNNYTVPGTYDVRLVVISSDGCTDTIIKPITISIGTGPVADFTMNDNDVCIPETITFSDTSVSSNTIGSWQWDFGDGSNSSLQNPFHTYTTVDTFTATLMIETIAGCRDTISKIIVTNGPSIADAGSDQVICNGDSASLTGSGGLVFSWSPSASLSSPNISNPSAFPTATTTYTLTVFDSLGCSDTDDVTVTVHPLPVVGSTDAAICIGDSVQLSASGGVSYSWSPASSLNNSNISNPIAFPDSTTTYTVIVIDNNGCENEASVMISVTTQPVYSISPDTSICKGDAAGLWVNGGTTFNWYPANGLSCATCSNPIADPDTTTTYYVDIATSGGCATTDSIMVTVLPLPTITISNDASICRGSSVSLNVSGGANYLWSPSNGLDNPLVSSPVASPDTSTTYTVMVIAPSGCSKNDSVHVEVLNLNAGMMLTQSSGCSPVDVQFTDLSSSDDPIISWLWNFGDGDTSNQQNPVHTYSTPGSYTVSLTVTNSAGCTGTKNLTDYMGGGSLDADFSVDNTSACDSVNANFTDLSTSSGTIISWEWDFGDGGSSNFQNPSHNYTAPGTYDVTLTLTDSSGCIDAITYDDLISVGTKPTASFTAGQSAGCAFSLTVNFTETATDEVSWFWDFGDGDTSTLQNLTHDYSMAGQYDVMLLVVNAGGCTDTIVKPITISIGTGPVADFTMNDNDVCIPETITFSEASVSANTIVSWQWDFGDGSSSSLQNPFHTYTIVDTFTVNLMIETIAGCRDTISKAIVTNGPSIADAGLDQVICVGDSASLTGSGGLVFSWSPSVSLSSPNISNPFAFPTATTSYTLTVFDSLGCSDTDVVTVTVHPMPVVSSADAAICIGDSVQLSASGGVNYSWSPASTLSNPNISNPIANPVSTTTYTITITDVNGCVNSISTTLVVNPLPIPALSAANQNLCEGQSVQLNATGGINYSWLPVTGLNNPNIPNPVSTPFNSVTYNVTVIDNNGCVSQDSISISVLPQSAYSISPDTSICKGDTVSFLVSGATGINWYPAAGLSCTTCNNPKAFPAVTAIYYAEISTGVGCTITDSIKVTVDSKQAITISKDTFICAGSSVQLNVSGGVNYVWSPATGLDNPNVPFPIASPDTSTTYTVQIISPFGCSTNDSVHVEVLDINADVTLSENKGCLPVDVQFTDLSSSDDSITSWLWNFDNGKFSSEQNPFQVFGTPGTYDINLTISTARGCIDSASTNVIVYDLPAVIAGPDTAICPGGGVQLYGSGGVYYNWSPSVGLNAIDIPNPVATPNITRYYELIVTDANGCINIDSVLITVDDLPVTTISADANLCYGDSTQLQVSGGTSYLWSPASGLSDPNISNPVASPETTTIYVVNVETEFGCNAVDSVRVVVHPKPLIVIKAEYEICLGDSTQFNVSGAVNYEWSPANGLNCLTCHDPVSKPDSSITYVVKMTDIYNCVWHDTSTLIVNPLPEIQTTEDKIICKGESVELTSQHTGATTYEWLPAYGLNASDILSPIATPDQTTQYAIIARNEFGCDDRDSVVINVLEHIQSSITDNQRICLGSSITLEARIDQSGPSGAGVIWMPETAFEDPTAFIQTVAPIVSTTYSVIAHGGQCVSDTQYVHVHVDESPDVDAGEDRIVMAGTEVTFTAASNYNITYYYWSPSVEMSCFDCQTTSVIAIESGTYYVNVTDANGCLAVDSVEVRVITTCDGDIWLPNAFTPNGDESNDEFRVRSTGFIELISFRVVDRWGSVVFETDNINEGWDGKYKGEFVNTGVYVWWIKAACSDGQVVEKKGNVTIIR